MSAFVLEVREESPGFWEWVIWDDSHHLSAAFEIDHGSDYRSERDARAAGEREYATVLHPPCLVCGEYAPAHMRGCVARRPSRLVRWWRRKQF